MGVALLILNICATSASICVSLSPTNSILQIHKRQDTGVVSSLTLIALLTASYIWTMYGFLKSNIFPVVVTNGAGVLTTLVFLAVYYRWCKDRSRFHKFAAVGLVIMVAVTIYSVLAMAHMIPQSVESVATVVGILSVCGSIFLYSSPLETLFLVFRTHDASTIPIALVGMGFCSNYLWLAYSYIIDDMFLLIPSAINGTLSLAQVALYLKFNPRKKAANMLPSVEIPTPHQPIQTTETIPVTIQPRTELAASLLSTSEDSSDIAIKIDSPDSGHYTELRSPAAASVHPPEIITCVA